MNTRKLISAPKAITKLGRWQCGAVNPSQKMGKQSFDFGSRRPFQLGNQWWWRVDELECLGTKGRLLTAYRLDKENFLAWLAIDRGKDKVLVACWEYHGNHPGWHVHSRCCDFADLDPGVQRQRNQGIRAPGKGCYHRRTQFEMSQQAAINQSYRRFNVGSGDSGELI